MEDHGYAYSVLEKLSFNRVAGTEDEKKVITQVNQAAERISNDLAQNDWAWDLPLAKLTSEGYY